jgi:hypothetical protein
MTDHIFSAVLAFVLLAGGTLAIGSAMFGYDRPTAPAQVQAAVIRLAPVEIIGHRANVVVARTDAASSTRVR